MISLGESLRFYRKKTNLSLRALSAKSSVPFETIHRIESGAIQDTRISTASKLADALKISLDELAGRA